MPQPLNYGDNDYLGLDADGNVVLYVKGAPYLTVAKSSGDVTLKSGADLTLTGNISAPVAARTRRVPLTLNLDASNPPTAVAAGLSQGLSFAADADDIVNAAVRVPSDWDGASDLVLKLRWTNTAATAIALDETVTWSLAWRSKAATEVYDAGTAGAASVTYTETGDPTGTDKATLESSLVIDYDDEDQPLAAGDLLSLELRRDVSEDDYAAGAVLLLAWLEYQSTTLAVE